MPITDHGPGLPAPTLTRRRENKSAWKLKTIIVDAWVYWLSSPRKHISWRGTFGAAVRTVFGIVLLALCQTNTWAAGSVFDGTWRAEYPQKFDPQRKPDVLELQNGLYTCKSCDPPYSLADDGKDHPVAGDPEFNTRSITIVDQRKKFFIM